MFDLDRWREIFQSISKNKLRSVMSGFTVAFAILLFTLLFGIVSGLSNSFKGAFVDDAMNTMRIRVWKTSKPYKGLQTGRKIQLKNKDFNFIKKEYDDKIQHLTARIYKNVSISYKNKSDKYSLRAVHPDDQFLEKTIIDQGRYINTRDLQEKSKVIVIGRLVKQDLFGEKPALGKRVNVNGISYLIIGIFSDDGGDREERQTYMPVTTAQMIYGNNDHLSQIVVGYDPTLSLDQAIAFGNKMERDLRKNLDIHPNDQGALSVRNMAEANKGIGTFMMALYFIVIFVGSGTLIAGIIGISNIMIFVIKERTKEFGIRKALGAKPSSIVGMVVQESVLITTIAGYLGLSLGTYILSLLGDSLEKYFIKDPSVSPGIVIGATVVLVLSGLIAGYLPAKRAANIKPIEALRAD
ncbi:ABC transporter permease [Tenacibaculum finnmarkense]|uniref:FtsX-like permease family protein n=1 Tax=Tenacibaculum finnmarkense genomovar finnmarkense TaxID=1458503 RepID=A0AAP1WG99_9FLAO|nr:ABC transporter permease [Tenacibaculum finnmarkense]MBE7652816.1 FtsX-like permease family protein [Tenacibaculum finnmarkense genomovar finnmarkense]MBE7695138.1 FtsX-like permease family protein [Tenacibaculum finnmarkense genomovar finnmarkense]MCD8427162.1 ABC transporter permease [Tenacibaculum finnmarkense genomovar finnmarkense]MCG8730836.1 FtsX-like permease family protein [Tenacibaculum finnmarkense]MCG8751331.1 FtsX-like permease family protein [Tenacibaculum finnmarkense]